MNLDERRNHFPAQLSGGEQQRVAIARAIAKRPAVLLCDEPTGALDISTGIVVLEALARVNAELGTTTVVITHNAAIAAMADRVIRLADGRVTARRGADREAVRRASSRGEVMALSALNRKLLRDLFEMKAQALAIAMVVAAGVAMFVMYLSNFDSLRRTQQAYYERQRFADVFASLKRAPSSLQDRIAAIPGVTAVDTRVVAGVTLDVPGLDEPASGLLISIDAERRPPVNDLFLRRGRWIDASRPDEVLASEGFVTANRLVLGDQVGAVINGRLRRLTIVGIALSPEHIYNIRPGEIVPDDRRFGTFWMERRALASAFDMEGGFNDVALALSPGASVEAVIAGSIACSNRTAAAGPSRARCSSRTGPSRTSCRSCRRSGSCCRSSSLSVAAFILNVALTRALALQRPQIAALKALGYANAALAWHYVKWALLIAGVGVIIGRRGRRLAGTDDHRDLQPVLPLPCAAVPARPAGRA